MSVVHRPPASPVTPPHQLAALVAAVVLAAGLPNLAAAQAQTPPVFVLQAQPLDRALSDLARQAGLQLLAPLALVKGREAPVLAPTRDLADALQTLLRGSGLRGRVEGRTLLIERLPAAAPSEAVLPVVRVSAGQDPESTTGPTTGYVARLGTTATKTDTPIAETPQSISVITRDRMDAQAVQTSEQALRYTAGVLTEVTGYDLRYQSLVVRGFDTANYRDGLRTFAAGSYADWVAEPQGLERIELLKGPASILYGQTAPGGLVNQVSKRPTADAINQMMLTVGNHDRYQTTLDVGGRLAQDGSLLVRVNALARDSGTQTDHSRDDRLYLAPSLTWRPTAATTVTFLADMTRDRVTPKSWWPDYALIDPNPNGRIPVDRYAGEPAFDHYNRDLTSFAYLLEHQLDADWTFRQNARYARFKLDYQHVYGDSWQDDLRTINRGTLVSRTDGHSVTVDNQVQGRFRTGELDHKVLLGVDYQRFRGHEDLGFDDAPPLDVFAPVYGAAVPMPDTSRAYNQLGQVGLYAQDQIKHGSLLVNVGLRHDRATTRNWDDSSFDLEQHDARTTYSAGVLYLLGDGLSPYASVATSFNPSVNVGFDGAAFKPETGKQLELGLKYQPAGTAGLVTLSVFDLRKQNVTTDDPVHIGYSVQTGEVRSRGAELEGTLALSSQLDVVGSYTYLDARVTRSNDATELGRQPRQTARNVATVWLDYRLASEGWRGWSVATGVRQVGRVAANPDNSRFNPAYTLVDAAVRYRTGPFMLSVNAANLFDKVYVANRAQFYGQGRALQATLAYLWQ